MSKYKKIVYNFVVKTRMRIEGIPLELGPSNALSASNWKGTTY